MEKYTEVWKPVVGFDGFFEVSCLGSIRSVDRVVNKVNKSKLGEEFNQIQKVKGKTLIKAVNRHGYEKLRTNVNGKRTNFIIHREIAKSFIPNPENKPQVNHIDGCKTNNCVSNLEWVTCKENMEHATRTGLRPKSPIGRDAYLLKYETKVFDCEGKYLYSCYGSSEVKDKGFDVRLVHRVCIGERKTHKNHKFEKHLI